MPLDSGDSANIEPGAEGPSSSDGVERRSVGEALEQLLAGEAIDRSMLSYDFDAWHLGVIASGIGAEDLLRRHADELDRELLFVRGEGETTMGWWGGPRTFEQAELAEISAAALRDRGLLAIGEPALGLAGWRATQRQARVAYGLARASRPVSRYGDVALLAAVAADHDLGDFLEKTFFTPLYDPSLRDRELPATLRAYLDARGQMSEAAVALHVDRGTLVTRIRMIEERIGRPLHLCLAELDLALRCQAVKDASAAA
jgi:hypothetical protein